VADIEKSYCIEESYCTDIEESYCDVADIDIGDVEESY